MNTKPETSDLEFLACVRLSEIGYRRFTRMADSGASEADLREFIDRSESKELTLSMLVRCAPIYNPIQ